jgi:hypothetical protein
VATDIGFIRDVLAARVFVLAGAPALAEARVTLDETERRWYEGIRLIYDDWGYPNEGAWAGACETLKALTALYRQVALPIPSLDPMVACPAARRRLSHPPEANPARLTEGLPARRL